MGTNMCGWCIDGDHAQCRVAIAYYTQVFACSCPCDKAHASPVGPVPDLSAASP